MVHRLKDEYAGKVDFTIYIDDVDAAGQAIADSLGGIPYVPTLVYVNADGTIARSDIGGASEAELRARLDALK